MNSIRRILLIFLLFSPLAETAERRIACKVIGISDGDTLTCLYNRAQLKVRLEYIDAPESSQPFGNRAKQALSKMVFKKEVILQISGYDRYQRLLAVVWDGQKNINLALVKQGMAWAYRQTQPIYRQTEAMARSRKLGLWQDKSPINPADWRASKRPNHTTNLPITPPTHPLAIDCSVKKSCNQFRDYPSAERHFRQCGWKTLDGNNDGIPCNKLYRKMKKP